MTKYAQLRSKYGRHGRDAIASRTAKAATIFNVPNTVVETLVSVASQQPPRPKMPPTPEQIAADRRRAFALQFQQAYISKGLTQESS